MDQLRNLADNRLVNGCIYCGELADTRDHVPSLVFLEPPYPHNLPVVDACKKCNQGFSKDEQYLVCLLKSAFVGSTEPDKIRRPSVARALGRSAGLRKRIDSARKEMNDRILFEVEEGRVRNVMLKLARGHAAFELSQGCRDEPDYFWCGPLEVLPEETQAAFCAPYIQTLFGEVGSRNIQRMCAGEVKLRSESGDENCVTGFS